MFVSLQRRGSWNRVGAACAGLLTAFAIGVVAQPPVEEEDPKGGLKKRVIVEDDPVTVKPQPRHDARCAAR